MSIDMLENFDFKLCGSVYAYYLYMILVNKLHLTNLHIRIRVLYYLYCRLDKDEINIKSGGMR